MTSYMGFKIPELGQLSRLNKLKSFAHGKKHSGSTKTISNDLQKSVEFASRKHSGFQKTLPGRNQKLDQSYGSNMFSSKTHYSLAEMQKQESTSAVSFGSRPSTNQTNIRNANSTKNFSLKRNVESLESKMK